MLFNSLSFLVFFPIVVVLYFLLPNRYRWVMLLAASYYFYMSWKAEYAFLIGFSTLVAYGTGWYMGQAKSRSVRRALLTTSLLCNLGVLFVFKYFNFFSDSLGTLANGLGADWSNPTLKVLLPVGISFYTFQTLSYSVDVYRGDRSAERHLGIFATYVAFFPQLVAGPIERSTHLLPQFYQKHQFRFRRFEDGLRIILWGFFKKIVIADRLAIYVNYVYDEPSLHAGLPLILATYFFAFQIYCDFSAYSDIAIGCSRIMGFDLMTNFRQPYFARSIREFWGRWHISLSTWFRDYLYIPLGGNRKSYARWLVNLMIVFIVSGLWHGASWTFVVWGALHGGYLVFFIVTEDLRKRLPLNRWLHGKPRLHALHQTFVTFHLVLFAWVFFRAENVGVVIEIFNNMAKLGASTAVNVGLNYSDLCIAAVTLVLLLIVDFKLYKNPVSKDRLYHSWLWRFGMPLILLIVILALGEYRQSDFIYFQF